jgi:four helix bundle protein
LGEENETEIWLDYSKDCRYITNDFHDKMRKEYDEVRKMLIAMINNPSKWCILNRPTD